MDDISAVKTVDRLVRVLDCFTPGSPAWSLADLSTRLDLPKSTLHRFLVSLEAHGILRRDESDKRWRLGYRLFVWGNVAVESTGLRQIAAPIMRELVGKTGETVILTVYRAHEVLCIEKVETRHPVRLAFEVGQRRPPHAGASSTVLMAFLSASEIEEIIAEGLPKLCTNTITDPDMLRQYLSRVRREGYAVSTEETDPDAWGVATPVYGANNEVIAAVGVVGPSSRFSDSQSLEYASACCAAARQISALISMGGAPGSDFDQDTHRLPPSVKAVRIKQNH